MPNASVSPQLQALQKFSQKLKERFRQQHEHAHGWLQDRSLKVSDFRTLSHKALAAASLAGTIALNAQGSVNHQVWADMLQQDDESNKELMAQLTSEEFDTVMQKLQAATTMPPGHLPKEDELYLEQQLSDVLGFEVAAELEGNRLNHSVGIMGGEQHLKRYPNDTLEQHDAYRESGIAPNRGAYGWFTENGELTQKAIEREKYYFAVQTLYLPDWNSNYKELKEWYKFRKMIVINPADRIAVVGVVGDAGPAAWVKKQYGGSPEIMREGKIWSPTAKGRVLLFFVNDPEDTIPLGVINLDQLRPTVLAQQ